MLALKIVLIVVYIIMLSIMFITERDKPKNIILWALAFFVLSIVAYFAYGISKLILTKKKQSLATKQWEDDVYKDLVSHNINATAIKDAGDFYDFNHLAYNANTTINNKCKVISSYTELKNELLNDLSSANELIIFEVVNVNKLDFEQIKEVLITKAKAGVNVKFVYDGILNLRLKRDLKNAGVKVYKFSKYNTLGGIYKNTRNLISIDNRVVYSGNLDIKNKQLRQNFDIMDAFIKYEGNVVQDIDLNLHQDVTFATGKFIEFKQHMQSNSGNCKVQFVSNSASEDLELLIVKAIITAKKSITLQLDEFIPTESIMSLLRFAINSNIDVKLMIPLKKSKFSTYYATRAYAKELALFGANVYLYDGFIRFNSIVVDEQFVLVGSFNINREHVNTSLQNIAVIEDKTVVGEFVNLFKLGIDNSYRINDARYMLLKEKFFKNFV